MKKIIFFLFLTFMINQLQAQVGTDKILYENTTGNVAGAYTVDQLKTYITTGLNSGTVQTISITSANGFTGSSNGNSVNPALTIGTSVTGVLKGNGTAISAATAGTDYSAGTSALGTGILKSTTGTGALTIAVAGDFPVLNQNTTGTASNVTGTVAVANGGTGATTLTGYLIGNGTSAVTASSTIPTTALSGTITNAQLANNAITINGTSRALGTSVTLGLQEVTTQNSTTNVGSTFTGGLTSTGATSITGGLNYGVGTQITANTTLATTDVVREINATATVTVTVPTGLTTGRNIILPLAQGSTGSVVIATAGAETFNGSATYTVSASSGGTTIYLTKVSSTNYKASLGW